MFENKYPSIIEVEDLCEILSIGRNTAYDLLRTKRIKAFRIGRKWKIPINAVKEYIGYGQSSSPTPFC